MSGIFKGKEEKQKSTSSSDPWETMPDEVKESILGKVQWSDDFMSDVDKVAADQAANPLKIADISDEELSAFKSAQGSQKAADKTTDAAMARLPGELRDFKDIDLEALSKGYENKYTGDVVDTTLAGMQREADRERLRRDAQSAAVGGTSNTRSAVADAVAQQLTGMNMGSMEAKLRSDAFDTASKLGLDAANFNLDEEQAATGWDLDRAGLDLDVAKTMEGFGGNKFNRGMTMAGLEGQMGETKRNIQDRKYAANKAAPTDAMTWQASMFGASNPHGPTPIGQTQTNTQTVQKPSTFSQLMGTAAQVAGAAIAASDPQVKSGIRDPAGSALDKLALLGAKSYEYKPGYGTPGRSVGLMADEVEESGIEGAVLVDDDGIRHVNIYPVLATVVDAVNELRDYRAPGQGLVH